MTLIEILAGLAVIGLGASLLTPRLETATSSVQMLPLATDMVSLLTHARNAAIATGGETSVIVDEQHGIIRAGALRVDVPRGTKLSLTAASSCRSTEAGTAVTFAPSGSSCGAVVELSQKQRHLKIRIDWYSGHVSIQRP
jgi:Tfp pilus assembly protein FimT